MPILLEQDDNDSSVDSSDDDESVVMVAKDSNSRVKFDTDTKEIKYDISNESNHVCSQSSYCKSNKTKSSRL